METAADDAVALDVQGLLQPFSPEAPAGIDPRDDISPQSRYFRLRDARADARASERGGDHDGRSVGAESHWRIVEENARRILIETGKDLEVAAWMTEAALRLHGLPGLAMGARLMTGLVEAFWSHGLYPLPDESGDDVRSIPLAGLNGVSGDGTLLQPLRMIMLFHRSDQSPLTLWQYEQAEAVEGIGDAARKKRRVAAGALSLSELEEEARSLGKAQLRAVGDDASAALTWWQALAQASEHVMGREAPPTSRVATLLEKIIRVAQKLAPHDETETESVAMTSADDRDLSPDHAEVSTSAGSGTADVKKPVTRDDMLRNLLVVAEYFRTHEPHSPLAYTLEEAVRRGRLSLLDLLSEVVPDVAARAAILSQLGIRTTSE